MCIKKFCLTIIQTKSSIQLEIDSGGGCHQTATEGQNRLWVLGTPTRPDNLTTPHQCLDAETQLRARLLAGQFVPGSQATEPVYMMAPFFI